MDLFDLSGKTAVVTGGSRGIGLMIARGLLEAGARSTSRPARPTRATRPPTSCRQYGDLHGDPGRPVQRSRSACAWPAEVGERGDRPWTSW